MPNIAALLKQEISRIVRKELRRETESLRKENVHYRAEMADLKRRVTALEQQLKAAERQSRRNSSATSITPEIDGNVRFRADGLKKHRERLGLSASVLASILSVSPQTIYNWEAGTSKPSKDQVIKIAILRKMGKREVQSRLKAMNG